MGEFADDALDDIIDFEEARGEYHLGRMPLEEAMDRGILDEFGAEPDTEPEQARRDTKKRHKTSRGAPMMRCNEPGWIQVALPDGRRGLWIRLSSSSIEMCAGREGDDSYVDLPIGHAVTEQDVLDARDCLADLQFAFEVAVDNFAGALNPLPDEEQPSSEAEAASDIDGRDDQ